MKLALLLYLEAIQLRFSKLQPSHKATGSRNNLRDLSGPVLRDTARLSQRYPPIVLWGVSRWPIGYDTPSPFSERFALGEHAKWRRNTPHKRGISAILARYAMNTRQNTWRYPPLRYYLERVLRDMGGISNWAAKIIEQKFDRGLRG